MPDQSYQLLEADPVLTIASIMLRAGNTAITKGFRDKERAFSTDIALCHSELSEALEADRNNEGSERKAEELADVIIRVCESAYHHRLPLIHAIIDKMNLNAERKHMHGKLY